jgi:hypothetical protein
MADELWFRNIKHVKVRAKKLIPLVDCITGELGYMIYKDNLSALLNIVNSDLLKIIQ